MTERLYLADPYVTSFDADILDTRETDDGLAIVFAATHFYPESGGQPHDLGTIDGIAVTRVVETPEHEVLHFVERKPEATHVHCEIDVARRKDHMQQHCGQHILSAAFVREADAHTTSFHLGGAVSTIDLDVAKLAPGAVGRAVRSANDVVWRAASIDSQIVSAAEARKLDLRKPPPEGEALRIVSVEGYDEQACCGTHPRSTSEVGAIVVRGVERVKGGTRVEFLCGTRVLSDYREIVGHIRALASVLSAPEGELVETATRLRDERKTMHKELEGFRSEALARESESWMDDATVMGARSVLSKVAPSLAPADLRAIAMSLTEKQARVVLLGTASEGRAHLVFARSKDGTDDMGELLRRSVASVDGKGGGSPQVAQGGGPLTEGLSDALANALRALSQVS